MNKALQLRKGTSQEHTIFTGLEAEVSVDIDKNTLVVHDGVTVGGHELVTLSKLMSEYAPKSNTLSGYNITDAYTKTESDILLNSKISANTTLDGYGITDAYTRDAITTLLNTKADASTTNYLYNMLTGVEFTTGNFKNGQEIFGILLDGVQLPINTTQGYPIPQFQSNFTYWLASGTLADNSTTTINLPYYHPVDGACSIKIINGNIEVTTTHANFGAYTATIVLNYVKNDITFIPNLDIASDLLWTSPNVDLFNTNLPPTDLF